MSQVLRPDTVDAALGFLKKAHADGPVTLLAGGTDLFPAYVGRVVGVDDGARANPLLDLSALSELRDIDIVSLRDESFLRLGALTTWTDIVRRRHPLLHEPALTALVMAAAEVGGVQIQNRGTIGGNLCNASPAADGVPALQALDAQIELRSAGQTRLMPITEFITGPRQTQRRSDEIVTAVLIPQQEKAASHSLFLKLGHRRYLVISAVMMAMRLDWSEQRLSGAAVSVGSCGPVATRLTELERAIVGMDSTALAQFAQRRLAPTHLSTLSPIDDLRGTGQFRLDAADILIRRALRLGAESPGHALGPTALAERAA